jgi:hypothetical protein
MMFNFAISRSDPMPEPSATSTTAESKFVQGVGLGDSTMLVAGAMIGSAIFIGSADTVRLAGCSEGSLMVTS